MDYIESKVSGIPCLIHVNSVSGKKPFSGSAFNCDSSDDYYGYSDVEFTVLDRKGYKAPWLEKKLTQQDISRIEDQILSN